MKSSAGNSDSKIEQLCPYECSLTDAFLVLGVLSLSLFDLVLTLDFIMHEGSEVNPIMVWALKKGYVAFIWIKIGLTVLGLIVLMPKIQSAKVRCSLAIILLLYTAVFNLHTYIRFLNGQALFSFVVP